MDFLKKHYEKILLSLVLAGLAGAAAWLPFAINKSKGELAAATEIVPNPVLYKPLDISSNEAALLNLKNPPRLELSGGHSLFNPAKWKRRSDSKLIKIEADKEGAASLVISKIYPLHLMIAFDRSAGPGFHFIVTREAAQKLPAKKNPKYAKIGDKNEFFTLKEVKGPAEDPTEFLMELTGSKEMVSAKKDEPFKKSEAFAVDFKYEIENKTFQDMRVNSTLTLGEESYKIIAITQNEVRVQAVSNGKQTTIRSKGSS